MAAAPDGAESRPIRMRGPRVDSVASLRRAVERAGERDAVQGAERRAGRGAGRGDEAARAVDRGGPLRPVAPPAGSTPDGGLATGAAAAVAVASAPVVAPHRPHAEDLPPRLFDPRETEDWFQRLPLARQQEIRAYWQWDAERGARWTAKQRHRQRRAAVDTGVLLTACWGLATVWSASSLFGFVSTLMWAFAIGAGSGAVLSRLDGGRFAAAFAGIVAWLVLTWSTGMLGSAGSSQSIGFFFLLGMWLNAHLFAVWGLQREHGDT